MEQKKKEYATPNMKEVKLNAQVALLDTSNKDEVGFARRRPAAGPACSRCWPPADRGR